MEHFKDFVIKLQTIDIKINDRKHEVDEYSKNLGYYDISHQNPYLSDSYRNELKELRELALTDILNLPTEQILLQLQRLGELKEKFSKFWKNFCDSTVPLRTEHLTQLLYSLDLQDIFIVPNISAQNHAIANDNFIDDLQDSIRAREKALVEFEKSVSKIVGLNKEPEKHLINKSFKYIQNEPVFKEGVAEIFFDLMKDYFAKETQEDLKSLLTQNKKLVEPLVFRGKGNQLADAFKQLFEANLIVSVNKAQLNNWVLNNFNYIDKGSVRAYSEKYLEDIISSNLKSCQSPILDVRKKDGQFFLYPVQRNNRNIKKYQG
jgi:hypothetical protein